MSTQSPTAFHRAYANPWFVLSLTCLFWAGNVIAGQLAVGEISPMLLGGGRWFIAAILLFLFARKPFLEDAPKFKGRWLRLTLMAIAGFTAYTALYYFSAHYTPGVNIAILQGVTPVMVFFGAWILWRAKVRAAQTIGCLITLVGVLLVATHGDLTTLGSLRFNPGDIGVIVAAASYACYSLALRNRPPASSMGFFVALAIVAALTSIPLVIGEFALGYGQWPTLKGLAILAYVAVFPTIVSQVCYIRGVELIGPSRASLFYNVTPVLGSIFSAIFLHEPVAIYHGLALALVIGGVTMAERLGR